MNWNLEKCVNFCVFAVAGVLTIMALFHGNYAEACLWYMVNWRVSNRIKFS